MLRVPIERLMSFQIRLEEWAELANASPAYRKALEIATKLLAEGEEPAWVARVTNLPQAEIDHLLFDIEFNPKPSLWMKARVREQKIRHVRRP